MGAPQVNYRSISERITGLFPAAGRTVTIDNLARMLEREFAPLIRQAHTDGRADGLNRSIVLYM